MGVTRTFTDEYPVPASLLSSDDALAAASSASGGHNVLIRVLAAGINPADYKAPRFIGGPIYGFDLCGVVVQIGDAVNEDRGNRHPNLAPLQVGDVVTGCPIKFQMGSLAEYTVSSGTEVTHILDGWTVEESAGLNVACNSFMTVLDDGGVLDRVRPSNTTTTSDETSTPPFQSILIIGSSGGCGTVALQICKGMGIPRIVGICSSKNVDFCKSLGATEVVPYDDQQAMEKFCQGNVGKLDFIYDTASDGRPNDYLLNPKIRAVMSEGNPVDPTKPNYLTLNASPYCWLRSMILGAPTPGLPRTKISMAVSSADTLDMAMRFINKAGQKPVIDTVMPEFTARAIEEAYEKLKSRRTKGKVVVRVAKETEK